MNEYIVTPSPIQNNGIFSVLMCGITFPDKSYYVKRNRSLLFDIEYVIKGEGTVFDNGKKYNICEGDVYILKQGHNHEYYADINNPWEKIWLNAKGTLIDYLLSVYGLSDITVVRNTDILDFLKRILAVNESQELTLESKNNKTAVLLHEMMQFLNSAVNIKKDKLSDEAVMMREYIESNFSEDISIAQLAGLVFRSESQTIRIFKSAFGITPYEYLLQCRIQNAKLLLKNTNLMIKETAYSVGFSDEHYFSDIFKKKTGISPREYKNR